MNKLITNNESSNFYNYITKLFNECNSFTINVAFINFSGIQLLFDVLKKLENRNIKGKVLTSTYLNFTQVEALKKLQEFKNIELKIFDCDEHKNGFHSKAYIFEFDTFYEVIIGSSNITSSAFKKNIEWNMSNKLDKEDLFLDDILYEFNLLWNKSKVVTDSFLYEYKDKTINIHNRSPESIIAANSMQEKALKKIQYLRANSQNKVLAIAATGTGKTYLAAFDVKKVHAKRLLFLVHRENILLDAKKTFEKLVDKKCGLLTGNKKEFKADYIFATIQSMNKLYKSFDVNTFDYIIVDEAHHITSSSYVDIMNYFEPDFLLGLTATPNRMDNKSIYEFFDDNIACDIRLNDALELDLISPFHYYGISDLEEINYSGLEFNNVSQIAKKLMVHKRVDYVIEKMNFYSFSGDKRKILAFCVNKEHAIYMSKEFNFKGINSTYLTSDDSINRRVEVIKSLESNSDNLEVVFTVDIFNEGIDIPSINTILMLRPTNSSIVFSQQLGRGLRKHKNKEFLTVLDFIGNHNRAYLIALALVGNKKIDKESIKISLLNNFANLQNVFIQMDEISKERILEQINKQNFSSFKYLKEQYLEFKLLFENKIPKLTDYLHYDEFISPLDFINESKSYLEFIRRVEKKEFLNKLCLDEEFIKTIRFLEFLLPIKRIEEFVILKYLLVKDLCTLDKAKSLVSKYVQNANLKTIKHSFEYLNQNYFDKAQLSRYNKLVVLNNDVLTKSELFSKQLNNCDYKEYIKDVIDYAIVSYEKTFGIRNYGIPFLKLYEKYNMLNIAQLCNFNKIHSSFRGSGFLKFENNFFLFISIEKDKFSKAAKYKNDFISKDRFTYISKPLMSQEKGDGLKLIKNKEHKVNLHIFVRKFVQVDKKTQPFIYLGLADTISYEGNKPITLELKLRNRLNNEFYEEFTRIID